jgi:hypothetical protein
MRFNSILNEEPYLGLTCQEVAGNSDVLARELEHRRCMVVVSSCLEVFG